MQSPDMLSQHQVSTSISICTQACQIRSRQGTCLGLVELGYLVLALLQLGLQHLQAVLKPSHLLIRCLQVMPML